jgi:aryl-alcohol dehydrogenase-like predicted oxidoreductase
MEKTTLKNTSIEISRIGIGGHYKAIEEGVYESSTAYVEREVEARVPIVARAIEAGINLFDTTWRNEVVMLAKVLERLGAREQVVVNGMVLGAFTGSKASGETVEDYFNKGLDVRLDIMPGNRFETFMINAIEEGYDAHLCERLLKVMTARKAAGDFKVIGLSCHDPQFARQVLDAFPDFELAMMPYNFRNRKFEEAFTGYTGNAAFIAIKPLVWTEYGIPFCQTNALPGFEKLFGFAPAEDAPTQALRFIRANPQMDAAFCSANSLAELELLIAAGSGPLTVEAQQMLEQYNRILTQDGGIPLFLSGLKSDNLRMNFFGVLHLARALGIQPPRFELNAPGAQAELQDYACQLIGITRERGFGKYTG